MGMFRRVTLALSSVIDSGPDKKHYLQGKHWVYYEKEMFVLESCYRVKILLQVDSH